MPTAITDGLQLLVRQLFYQIYIKKNNLIMGRYLLKIYIIFINHIRS